MTIGDGIAVAGSAIAAAVVVSVLIVGTIIARMHAAELIMNGKDDTSNISRKKD